MVLVQLTSPENGIKHDDTVYNKVLHKYFNDVFFLSTVFRLMTNACFFLLFFFWGGGNLVDKITRV